MNTHPEIPSFDALLPDLNQFILGLVEEYKTGKINSWDDLEEKVTAFFTPEMMSQVEAIVPHWRKMASYAEGITLVHVMCVFLGLSMLPEFLRMSTYQQTLMKWIILFHDVEKEPQGGKRDHPHAFRSAVGAAQTIAKIGFPTTTDYDLLIDEWSEFTRSALTLPEDASDPFQDNRKLPQILDGIERMFGYNAPAALIVKTILFHLSVGVTFWPPPAPLTNEEMKEYFDHELIPLLKVMHLADNEGWSMFVPENRERGRVGIIEAFDGVERLVSD
jgi:hypothetical protein